MNHSNGTFVAVRFREDIVDTLIQYALENGVPNPLSRDKIHTTIVYSRKPLIVEEQRDLDTHWIGKPIGFDVFTYRKKDDGNKNCLVLKLHSEQLFKRHAHFRILGASHDYPTYQPHITLSYDIGDYDISKLPPIESVLPEIYMVQEYSQELIDEDRRKEARQEES